MDGGGGAREERRTRNSGEEKQWKREELRKGEHGGKKKRGTKRIAKLRRGIIGKKKEARVRGEGRREFENPANNGWPQK